MALCSLRVGATVVFRLRGIERTGVVTWHGSTGFVVAWMGLYWPVSQVDIVRVVR